MEEVKFKDFINYDKRIGKIIISGEEGNGKTLLLVRIAIGKMLHGMEDTWKSYDDVREFNKLGFNFSTDYEHCCFANLDINCSGTSIPGRRVYMCNPFKLGYFREDYETDLYPTYSLFCITEGKNYFDSYNFDKFHASFISYFKTQRHFDHDLVLDTQYFGDICTPIRRITNRFIYLHKRVEHIFDSDGNVIGHKLFVIEWNSNRDIEYFERTAKKQNCKEYVLVIDDMCLFKNYDSKFCKFLHLRGREDQDFNIRVFPSINSIEDLELFGEDFGFDIPDGFYKSSKKKIKNEGLDNIDEDIDIIGF